MVTDAIKHAMGINHVSFHGKTEFINYLHLFGVCFPQTIRDRGHGYYLLQGIIALLKGSEESQEPLEVTMLPTCGSQTHEIYSNWPSI